METAVTFKDWTIFVAIRTGGPTATTTWNPAKGSMKYITQNNNDNDNDNDNDINFDNDNTNDTDNDNDNNHVNDSDGDIDSERTDRNLSLGRIELKPKQSKTKKLTSSTWLEALVTDLRIAAILRNIWTMWRTVRTCY